MKWMKRLLYSILALLSLVSIFIILCAFWPGLADKASDFLYSSLGKEEPVYMEETEPDLLPEAGMDMDLVETDEGTETGQSGGDGMEPEQEGNKTSGYVAPEREEIHTPEEVAGRNGYIPVQENAEEINEEEAEELRKKYTYGETGEGLSFDTEFYPYYGMLSEPEQSIYRQIYANAGAVNRIFNPVEPVTQRELRNSFIAVVNDHPELFWLDSAYEAKFARGGGCAEISLQFNDLVDDLDAAKGIFQSAAEEILAGARSQSSDYEKELYVHNALLDRIEYDLQAPLNQSAYSALANGRTVCAGYARSMQYLMTQLGVPCYYCTGFAGENHAWNIIRLEDEYYNADATWDDTDPNTYRYLNRTDQEFSLTHKREDLSVYLPPCNGTKYRGPEEEEIREDEPEDNRRSMEDAGFSEEDVISGMEEYYEDCYNKIMTAGNPAEFESVVDSEELWLRCYRAYEDDSYSAEYMDRVLEELQAGGCEVDIEAESLRDGRVLLHHRIRFF